MVDKVHFPGIIYLYIFIKSCINMFKVYVYASKNNLRRWRKGRER